MTQLESRPGPRHYLSILRHHVLEPVISAEKLAQQERTEVARERDAFDAFADRVADITPKSPKPPALMAGSVESSTSVSETPELQQSYENTVMAVPHYDDVFGESIKEHSSAEFGAELASLLSTETRTSFTQSHKQALIAAAKQRANDRDIFCDRIDSELDSLGSMRHDLTNLLDNLDTNIVPAWYREQFEDELMQVLRARQSTIGSRSLVSYVDGHSLCGYLYDGKSWTYPVLTAIARLRDSVTYRD